MRRIRNTVSLPFGSDGRALGCLSRRKLCCKLPLHLFLAEPRVNPPHRQEHDRHQCCVEHCRWQNRADEAVEQVQRPSRDPHDQEKTQVIYNGGQEHGHHREDDVGPKDTILSQSRQKANKHQGQSGRAKRCPRSQIHGNTRNESPKDALPRPSQEPPTDHEQHWQVRKDTPNREMRYNCGLQDDDYDQKRHNQIGSHSLFDHWFSSD